MMILFNTIPKSFIKNFEIVHRDHQMVVNANIEPSQLASC